VTENKTNTRFKGCQDSLILTKNQDRGAT